MDVAEHVPDIRPGMLFRTAWGLDPGLVSAVTGPTVNIDLRRPVEKTEHESRIDSPGIVEIPIHQEGVAHVLGDLPGRSEYTAMYCGMVDNCGLALARVLGTVSRSLSCGVVVGCSMGKDRTGVALALILASLGTPFETILRAEHQARAQIATVVQGITDPTWFTSLTCEQILHRLAVGHESIGDCLRHCETNHGSVAGYLAEIGVTAAVLTTFKESLAA